MDYKVKYRSVGTDTTTGPSANLWGTCPIDDIKNDMAVGYVLEDDFLNFSDHISAQNVQGYASYIDTGVTLKQGAADVGGAVEVAGNDADNDEGSITSGGNAGGAFLISDTAGSEKKLWFEARFKKASIADNALAMFVGLSEEGLAAANTLIDDTGALASKDMIGFNTLQADGDALVFSYRKAGQAVQTIALDSGSSALTADTYVKVGFIYDPLEVTAKRITLFVNGVEQSTYGTGANISAATFPDGEELAFLLATKVGAAAESKLQLDWFRCVQLR